MAESAMYPTTITSQLYRAVARLSTTLSSDITNSTTPIPVAAVTSFPTAGFITIDNETIFYNGNTTTLGSTSATRGFAGTAVAHLKGAAVKYSIVAVTTNRIQLEIEATQTHVGTSGGTAAYLNSRKLYGMTAGQFLWSGSTSPDSTELGGSTEGQLSVTYLGGTTLGQIYDYADVKGIVLGTSVTGTTITPARTSNRTQYSITEQAAAVAIAEPTGTPLNGDTLVIRIEDDGTGRAITWDAIFEAKGVDLPSTTTASKMLYVGFVYNSTDSKWDCIASSEEE